MSNPIKPKEMVTFDSSGLTGGYDKAHTGFDTPILLLKIINKSDKDLEVSYSGKTSNDFVISGETLTVQLDNVEDKYKGSYFINGTSVWLKGVAGTGNVYIVTYSLFEG